MEAAADRYAPPPRRAATAAAAGPLYPRLPRGPHSLDRRAVARNQRARIFGAMAEAVARAGYREASVKDVVALAGVSRRSFYEQFANKEACFVAAFDMIAARAAGHAARAHSSADGGPPDRLEAALASVARTVAAEPKHAALVACDARLAGRPPLARLRAALTRIEQPLGASLARRGQAPLPPPVVRALVGGGHALVACHLERGRAGASPPDASELAARLAHWCRPFAGAGSEQLARALSASAAARLGEGHAPSVPARRAAEAPGDGGERLMLMASALRLAVIGDFHAVTAPQIADEAGVAARAFAAHFETGAACYAAALDEVAATLLNVVARAGEDEHDDWPARVRAMLRALLDALAARPLHAHTLAHGIHSAGRPAVARGHELLRAIAGRLTADGPAANGPSAAIHGARRGSRAGDRDAADRTGVLDAIAGALSHTIGVGVASGRTALLPAVSDHLVFAVLATQLGGEAASARLAADGTA